MAAAGGEGNGEGVPAVAAIDAEPQLAPAAPAAAADAPSAHVDDDGDDMQRALERIFGVAGEQLLAAYSCALETSQTQFPGKLFIFESAAGFFASVLGHEVIEVIRFQSVEELGKRNLALFLPHGVDIHIGGRTVRAARGRARARARRSRAGRVRARARCPHVRARASPPHACVRGAPARR